jgi:hypothetical protein
MRSSSRLEGLGTVCRGSASWSEEVAKGSRAVALPFVIVNDPCRPSVHVQPARGVPIVSVRGGSEKRASPSLSSFVLSTFRLGDTAHKEMEATKSSRASAARRRSTHGLPVTLCSCTRQHTLCVLAGLCDFASYYHEGAGNLI